MTAYYPYGNTKPMVPTKEQIDLTEEKFKRYDYYGIPYGRFDELSMELDKKEDDRRIARSLILRREAVPRDLEERFIKVQETR